MGIDHGGGNVGMAQQFLHGPDEPVVDISSESRCPYMEMILALKWSILGVETAIFGLFIQIFQLDSLVRPQSNKESRLLPAMSAREYRAMTALI